MQILGSIQIPQLVRTKPGALGRLGIYLRRQNFRAPVCFVSQGLPAAMHGAVTEGFRAEGITERARIEVTDASLETAMKLFTHLAVGCDAVLGIGGGKALDVAKYVAHLANLPYIAAPTSLSNDGFCTPQPSLTVEGRRKSLAARLPWGVVIDTEVCLRAPDPLWWSGVGDLVAKLTAHEDWRLAFEAVGTPVNDFAALIAEATVYQFIGRPARDLDGVQLLATALMLSGVAMEICNSSRPASGSEHLISHALDAHSARPRLHGLQVGVASYVVSRLQSKNSETIATVLDQTGFWRGIEADPFSRAEWLEAVRRAPSIKDNFYTVLTSRDCLPEVEKILNTDPRLAKCFRE